MNHTILKTKKVRLQSRVRSAVLLAVITLSLVASNRNQSASTAPSNATPGSGAQTFSTQNSYADLVSRVAPAVVTVHSAHDVKLL
jgi:S1-C subfamily serine protease